MFCYTSPVFYKREGVESGSAFSYYLLVFLCFCNLLLSFPKFLNFNIFSVCVFILSVLLQPHLVSCVCCCLFTRCLLFTIISVLLLYILYVCPLIVSFVLHCAPHSRSSLLPRVVSWAFTCTLIAINCQGLKNWSGKEKDRWHRNTERNFEDNYLYVCMYEYISTHFF